LKEGIGKILKVCPESGLAKIHTIKNSIKPNFFIPHQIKIVNHYEVPTKINNMQRDSSSLKEGDFPTLCDENIICKKNKSDD